MYAAFFHQFNQKRISERIGKLEVALGLLNQSADLVEGGDLEAVLERATRP